MNTVLLTQLKILKMSDIKPNFSELARLYEMDRRTIKKYYEGYEGKPKNRSKIAISICTLFVLPAKISELDLKYMSRLGLAYSF